MSAATTFRRFLDSENSKTPDLPLSSPGWRAGVTWPVSLQGRCRRPDRHGPRDAEMLARTSIGLMLWLGVTQCLRLALHRRASNAREGLLFGANPTWVKVGATTAFDPLRTCAAFVLALGSREDQRTATLRVCFHALQLTKLIERANRNQFEAHEVGLSQR
jgi:hypothetical protein